MGVPLNAAGGEQEIVKPELGMFEPTDGDEYSYQLATHIDTKCGETTVGAQTVTFFSSCVVLSSDTQSL